MSGAALPWDEQIQSALTDAGFDESDVANATDAVLPVLQRALKAHRSVTFYRDQPPVWWGGGRVG